jgi:hypothetical protein
VEYGGGFQGRLTAMVDTFEIFIGQKLLSRQVLSIYRPDFLRYAYPLSPASTGGLIIPAS